MLSKLFVRNIPFATTEEDLSNIFSNAGVVRSVKMPLDQETNRKRGFAFVEMQTAQDAARAIEHMNNSYVGDRQIVVEYAKERNAA